MKKVVSSFSYYRKDNLNLIENSEIRLVESRSVNCQDFDSEVSENIEKQFPESGSKDSPIGYLHLEIFSSF